MTDISRRKPGYNLMVKLHEVQSPHEPSALGKFFGYSALNPESVSWWRGIEGEQAVGRKLDELKTEGYTVLHSVPIGKNESDIDHVVISPSGVVYTINTKHHKGKKVTAYQRGINVGGQNQPYYRNSKYEAGRVRTLFKTKLGVDVEVVPVLVFLGADLTIKGEPDVTVLTYHQLITWMQSQESDSHTSGIDGVDSVKTSDFWSSKTNGFEPDKEEVYVWYDRFIDQQLAAIKVRALWILGGFLAFLGAGVTMTWIATVFFQLTN